MVDEDPGALTCSILLCCVLTYYSLSKETFLQISKMRLVTMFQKLSLNSLLYIFVMAMAFSDTDKNAKTKWHSVTGYHSLTCLIPLHYNFNISLVSDYLFQGESEAAFYIKCPMQNLIFFISQYTKLTELYLKSTYKGIIYTPKRLYKREERMVILNLTKQLLPEKNLECGFYTLYTKFLNHINDTVEFSQTWYTGGKENKIFVATLFQRRKVLLFPCWEESKLRATFKISVEHDKKYTFLSNMPIQGYKSVDDDRVLTLFDKTPPMFTNDITLIMMSNLYGIIYKTETKTNMWCRSNLIPYMKLAQYVVGNVTLYLEDNWKIFKSVPKVDYVVVPTFEDKIWPTLGLRLYNETYVIHNEEIHPAAFKNIVMRTIAHDIVYQWFGELFSPSCCTHWWLNEGFIIFLEMYILDKTFPNSRIMDLFIVQIQHESRHQDIKFLYDIYNIFIPGIFKVKSFTPYRISGFIMWRNLELIVPHNAFWTSINTYVNTRLAYFNLTHPDDLWNIMQTDIDKLKIENYKLNVTRIMKIWSTQMSSPVLNVTRNYFVGLVNITKDKFDQAPYFIPITYTTETKLNFNISIPTIDYCLTESNPELNIPINAKDKWIIVNIQQTGYYRVNYDPENWRRIARYLNSENYTNIHVLNRAQIIDDAFHLALERKQNFSIFWELASYLPRREKDFIAWYPMIKFLEYTSCLFAFSKIPEFSLNPVLEKVLVKIENLFEPIEEQMYDQMEPVKDDFSKFLKQELAKWGCVIGNKLCIEMAKHKLELYVQNRSINKIMLGWHKWTFCNGLKTATVDTWFSVFLMAAGSYIEEFDHKMLESLSCSENINIIFQHLFTISELEYTVLRHNKHKMPPHKIQRKVYIVTANMFLSTLARHTRNITILKEILKNYENIQHSQVSLSAAFIVIINNVYSIEQLDEISNFANNTIPHLYSKILYKTNVRTFQFAHHLIFLNSLYEKEIRQFEFLGPELLFHYENLQKSKIDIFNETYVFSDSDIDPAINMHHYIYNRMYIIDF